MAEILDLVIIGSGPGGYVAAIRAGQLGLKTALVEKEEKLGGTCLHRGCIPTKCLLWTAELYSHILEAATFGIELEKPRLNWEAAQAHKAKVVNKGASGIDFLMKKNNVEVVYGHGRLLGKGQVEVAMPEAKKLLQARHIILATGSIPRPLSNVAVDGHRVLNSDFMLEIPHIPSSLIVLGAGAVGTEFASIFNQLGTQVTLVEYMPHILPFEDEDISKELEKHLKRKKMKLALGTSLESIEAGPKGVKVLTKQGEETKLLEAEYLLSAVGRAPATSGVGLENTAIVLDGKGFVPVDAFQRTVEPHVYAIGDICPTPMLAHVASAQAVLAVEHLAGKRVEPIRYDRIPSATYGFPEVASVGLSEKKAKEKGYEVKTGIFPFSAISKAGISNQAIGLAKMVADKKYDEVLGIHLVGPHATELLAEACIALRLESTTEDIARTIHAHPTLSEIMKEAAEMTLGRPTHI
ncbi:MAG: dihydrolipoyl dehydrogenase [Cystobacterineae bacterium]|nr:dihydrolipoyl dehydrogenase [Cystobacterineae bacterium]